MGPETKQHPTTLVLPRDSTTPTSPPIHAPSEECFTNTFGKLLPPAQFVTSELGRYAYYTFTSKPDHSASASASASASSSGPDRVLLIHGVQTPSIGLLALVRQLQGLSPRTQFVLVDLWGHGLSWTPVAAHTEELFHFQIMHLLDRLGWASVHLIGYSFGGVLTAGLVGMEGVADRVRSYVLVAPAGLLRLAAFPREQRELLGKEGCVDEDAAGKLVVEVLEGGEMVVPRDWRERVGRGEVVAQAVKEWQMREHKGHFASVVAIFRDGGVMDNDVVFEKAVQTGIPNIIVLGELDDVCSEEELRAKGFTDVFVVPGIGHAVVREREQDVARHIANFWSKLI